MKKVIRWLLILLIFGIGITCTVSYKSTNEIKLERTIKNDTTRIR